jgi:type I restriction enzyme S subunit
MKTGWKYKKLGELFPIIMGKTPPRNIARYWDEKKTTNNLWVSISDLSKNEGKQIYETKEHISDEGKQNIKLIPKGSLLVSFKLTLGKMAFAGKDLYTNEAIISLLKREDVDLMFIYYYFSHLDWNKIASGNEKVKGKTLNKKSLSDIPIAYLSIDEQQAIVAHLNSAFSTIDSLKSNAEKQLAEARALFKRALKEEISLKNGWSEKTLEELATDMYRGSGIKRDQITTNGTPCVRYGEIYTTYNVSFDKCVSHTDLSSISSPKYFEHGDLLFAITGESVEDIGKTIAYLGNDKCLLGGDIICMKHKQNAKYLSYALSTPDAIRQKGIGKTKLKVVHTNAPALKAIKLPIPSLETQEKIVSKLDALSDNIKRLEELQRNIEAECDVLKKALLREVFE